MNKSEKLLEELEKFSRYDPGKPIVGSEGKEIENSTALSPTSSAYYDDNPKSGGHFIERHTANEGLQKLSLTHEEAGNLMQHFKRFANTNPKETDPDAKLNQS